MVRQWSGGIHQVSGGHAVGANLQPVLGKVAAADAVRSSDAEIVSSRTRRGLPRQNTNAYGPDLGLDHSAVPYTPPPRRFKVTVCHVTSAASPTDKEYE